MMDLLKFEAVGSSSRTRLPQREEGSGMSIRIACWRIPGWAASPSSWLRMSAGPEAQLLFSQRAGWLVGEHHTDDDNIKAHAEVARGAAAQARRGSAAEG